MKTKHTKELFLIVILPLILTGCAAQQNYLVNLSFVKEAVIDYQENGGFHRDAAKAVDEAMKKFDKIIPENNSAVVFDIDETVLSNYSFNKEWDFGFIEKYWDMWVDSAKAPAVTEVQNLYNYLVKRGFKIIFISGRKNYQYDPTKKNLISAGYKNFDTLIVRQPSEYNQTALEFKSEKRTELSSKGYEIVGTVGDQWSDLDGPFHGIQVKIPDYQYYIK